MPYPLPEGDSFEASQVWRLIAVPNRPEYLQAGLGHLTDLALRHFWGKEGIEEGSEDASQSWHLANAETLRLWDMNPLEVLIDQTDEIESLLIRLINAQCCSPGAQSVTGNGNAVGGIGDEVPPESGFSDSNPPPDYLTDPTGQTEFEDATAWRSHKCKALNVIFDYILNLLRYARFVKVVADRFFDLLSWALNKILPLLLPDTGLEFVVMTAVQAEAALNDYWVNLTTGILDDAIGSLEENRDEIICSLLNGQDTDDLKETFVLVLDSVGVPAAVIGLLLVTGVGALFTLLYTGVTSVGDYAGSECDTCDELQFEWGVKWGSIYPDSLPFAGDWAALSGMAFADDVAYANANGEAMAISATNIAIRALGASGYPNQRLEVHRITLQAFQSLAITNKQVSVAVAGTTVANTGQLTGTPDTQYVFDLDPPIVMTAGGQTVQVTVTMPGDTCCAVIQSIRLQGNTNNL